MQCSECGTTIDKSANFCPECGVAAGSAVGERPRPGGLQRRGDTGYDRSVNVVTQVGSREGFCPLCNRGRSLRDSFVCWRCKMMFLCPDHQDAATKACERCARELAQETALQMLQAERDDLGAQLRGLQDQRQRLAAALQQREHELAGAQAELTAARGAAGGHVSAAQRAQAERQRAVAKQTELEQTVQRLTAEAEDLRRRLAAVQTDLAEAQAGREVDQRRIAELTARAAQKTRSGLPLIEAWEELRGRAVLPPRIIWAGDGKEMALIPGGPFRMGTPEAEARKLIGWIQEPYALAEAPQRTAALPAFYIDVTPVTHAEYAAFIAANPAQPVPSGTGSLAQPLSWDKGQRTPPAPYAQHPVVLVSWHDARAYAEWAGKALPGEPQWEKAARGADGRLYPWGDAWDRTRCNSAEGHHDKEFASVTEWWNWWNPIKDAKEPPGVFTTPVGSYPAGATPEGVLDLAGNVWEWCADWYQPYPGTPSQNKEFGETFRVVRGGSWNYGRTIARAAYRGGDRPGIRIIYVGFRCASTPF